MANEIVKFEKDDGQKVEFTADDLRKYLCPTATDSEIAMAMALCQSQRLDPFIKDVYIVKYGNGPASIVTGKEVFTKRAQANPKFDGMQAGITVIINGQIVQREGSMMVDGWTLIGGWCKVYVKDYRVPIYDEVSLAEYSTGRGNWAKMPATMIRKVALCHALREAFPDDFQGLYGAEEMGKAGESVETQNHPSEPSTAPQSGIDGNPMEAEFVEVVSEEEMGQLYERANLFAELCDRDPSDVYDALAGSRTLTEAGVETVDQPLTPGQWQLAMTLLDQWIVKAEDARAAAEALSADDDGLLEADIEF